MNWSSLALLLCMSVVTLTASPVTAKPFRRGGSGAVSREGGRRERPRHRDPVEDEDRDQDRERDRAEGRRTRSGRKMKELQKLLRLVTPQDLLHLAHSSKRTRKQKYQQYVVDTDVAPLQLNIPQIECPQAEDGIRLFACPSPDKHGVYKCIDDHALCDNRLHCPNGEDEDTTVCMFHRMTLNYFQMFMEAVQGMRHTDSAETHQLDNSRHYQQPRQNFQ